MHTRKESYCQISAENQNQVDNHKHIIYIIALSTIIHAHKSLKSASDQFVCFF